MMKPMSKLMQVGWEQQKVLNRDNRKGLDQMNWMFDRNADDELTFDQ